MAVMRLAEWAGVAIDNARLYEAAERRRRDLERAVLTLEATSAVALAVGGDTDLSRVLELIVKRGRALVEARTVLIALEEHGALVVAATAGELRSGVRGTRLPIVGTVERVLRTRRAVRLPDVASRILERRHAARPPGLDRAPGAADLSVAPAGHALRVRPHDRRPGLLHRGRTAPAVLRRERRDGGGDGAHRRTHPPDPDHRGRRAGTPPLGARAPRRDAPGARGPAAAPLDRPHAAGRATGWPVPSTTRSSSSTSRSRTCGAWSPS